MAASEQQFGLEIKLLRESRKLSAKELAAKVGLSPSQMSRLESGQRRIEALLLSKIARALEVHPSHFFKGFEGQGSERSQGGELPSRSAERSADRLGTRPGRHEASFTIPVSPLGKLIRAERRRRHLTADELGQKIGKGKTYVQDVEASRTDLVSAEVLQKIAKVLKLDAELLIEAQRSEIHELRKSLRRLERAHTERTLGELELEGPGTTRRGIPIVESELGGLPTLFDKGVPEGRVVDVLYLPGLRVQEGFAVVWRGNEMEPGFEPGDLLVFDSAREARHREFVLAVLAEDTEASRNAARGQTGRTLFRRLFLEAKGLRLQPLNLDFPPATLAREEVSELFPLVARLHRF